MTEAGSAEFGDVVAHAQLTVNLNTQIIDYGLSKAARAVLDKDHFPILHLESGMAYRLRLDNLLHWTALSAT